MSNYAPNKFPKKCYKCGVKVQAYEGVRVKKDHEFIVYHHHCKPGAKPHQSSSKSSEMTFLIESEVLYRRTTNQPMNNLDTILNFVKDLESKTGFDYSISGDKCCKNCGQIISALDS